MKHVGIISLLFQFSFVINFVNFVYPATLDVQKAFKIHVLPIKYPTLVPKAILCFYIQCICIESFCNATDFFNVHW